MCLHQLQVAVQPDNGVQQSNQSLNHPAGMVGNGVLDQVPPNIAKHADIMGEGGDGGSIGGKVDKGGGTTLCHMPVHSCRHARTEFKSIHFAGRHHGEEVTPRSDYQMLLGLEKLKPYHS